MVNLMGLFLNTVHRRFQEPTFEKSLYHFGRLFLTFKSPSVDFSQVPKSCAVFVVFTLKHKISIILKMIQFLSASFPVALGNFGCDVTCQACRENSPRTPRAIALGSKPPLVTRIARTGLGTRLNIS